MGSLARARRLIAVLGAFVLVVTAQGLALADGTETLGAPSVAVAAGSGTVASGTGLQAGSGTINVTVPGTPKQALLYWEVQLRTTSTAAEVMTVNGGPVTGNRIGGPTTFFSGRQTTVYRADVTSLVSSGANSLTLVPNTTGVSTGVRINDGAGLIVIYDDGTTAEIGIRDGADVAWAGAPDVARQTTIPQTFSFAPEAGARTSTLTIFTASVSDDVDGPPLRPTGINVSSGIVTVVFDNVLDSTNGNEWDTFVAPITIPAGANSLTVQVESVDNLGTGLNPASLVWIGAGLVVPVTPPPPPGGEGCTPGYWKQSQHFDSWPGAYTTNQSYATTFDVSPSFNKTLLGALQQGGGGQKALGRHATAALLNSANPNVSYLYSTADVIGLVQSAYVSGDYEGVKNLLETQNEMGCPLN